MYLVPPWAAVPFLFPKCLTPSLGSRCFAITWVSLGSCCISVTWMSLLQSLAPASFPLPTCFSSLLLHELIYSFAGIQLPFCHLNVLILPFLDPVFFLHIMRLSYVKLVLSKSLQLTICFQLIVMTCLFMETSPKWKVQCMIPSSEFSSGAKLFLLSCCGSLELSP